MSQPKLVFSVSPQEPHVHRIFAFRKRTVQIFLFSHLFLFAVCIYGLGRTSSVFSSASSAFIDSDAFHLDSLPYCCASWKNCAIVRHDVPIEYDIAHQVTQNRENEKSTGNFVPVALPKLWWAVSDASSKFQEGLSLSEEVQGKSPRESSIITVPVLTGCPNGWKKRGKDKERFLVWAAPFDHEVDHLEALFHELRSEVDLFIIQESSFSYLGQSKLLHFKRNFFSDRERGRFHWGTTSLGRYLWRNNKIRHSVFDDISCLSRGGGFECEGQQRLELTQELLRLLKIGTVPEDAAVIYGDVDELVSLKTARTLKRCDYDFGDLEDDPSSGSSSSGSSGSSGSSDSSDSVSDSNSRAKRRNRSGDQPAYLVTIQAHHAGFYSAWCNHLRDGGPAWMMTKAVVGGSGSRTLESKVAAENRKLSEILSYPSVQPPYRTVSFDDIRRYLNDADSNRLLNRAFGGKKFANVRLGPRNFTVDNVYPFPTVWHFSKCDHAADLTRKIRTRNSHNSLVGFRSNRYLFPEGSSEISFRSPDPDARWIGKKYFNS